MVGHKGKVTGAGGSKALTMDPHLVAGGRCNGGCPSLQSLIPKSKPRTAIVTPGCVEAQDMGSALKP